MEIGFQANADGDGEGDGQESHSDVSYSQGDQEVVGGILQGAVDGHSPAHQDVARNGEHSNQQLSHNVDHDAMVPQQGRGGRHVKDGVQLTTETNQAATETAPIIRRAPPLWS